ncbi:MAG: flagellar biosynthetic protein FliO [Luminiphilus sp.]|nr:flagellar biosynthetic protein FliO [Luminiphilus sp.]MDG1829339.1 flagellar biosynthetic protein FliO [Luminiphilus sp.]
MSRILLLLMCIPSMALAETGAGETLPSTADLFSWSYLGQVIASLALVIGLLLGALWIMRRVNGVGQAVGGQMRVVSSLGLGQRERAVLVSVGDQQILLGVAPGRVAALHVFDEPAVAQDITPAPPLKFSEVWQNVMGKKDSSS